MRCSGGQRGSIFTSIDESLVTPRRENLHIDQSKNQDNNINDMNQQLESEEFSGTVIAQ
jgi:hypothetical protein